MKISRRLMSSMRAQHGATAIMVAVAMVVLVSIAAVAVDVGYVMVTRNELQNVADAAALAATRQLGSIYETMSYYDQQTYVCDPSAIVPVAQDVANQNQVGGASITIAATDVIIGRWDSNSSGTDPLTVTLNQPDAVRAIVRRDSSINGPITTFFAKIFGVDSVEVTATATAALTGQSTAGEGGVELPVGISKKWFEPGFCDQPIKFYPTGTIEGCAGWHTFTDWPANANKLANILDEMRLGSFQSPATEVGDMFVFTGGTVASAFDEMKALYEANKDPVTGEWETHVVVYNYPDCSNPTGQIEIVGFATAIVTEILVTPEKTIVAIVKCDNVEFGRGSGGDYGTKGSIPGLVE